MDAVVALGDRDEDGSSSWVASGFLYGSLQSETTPEGQKLYRLYLVTNRHVAETLERPVARFNPSGLEPAKEFGFDKDSNGRSVWYSPIADDVDVAVCLVNHDVLVANGIVPNFFASDDHALRVSELLDSGCSEGDGVFLLGFPMGQVGATRNAVIVRGGWVARLRDLRENASDRFLVDSWVFPGNSGGPVVIKPETVSIMGTKDRRQAHLIGVTASYLPYEEIAISLQTKRARIMFEENSGLVEVFPVDAIDEAIKIFEDLHPSEASPVSSDVEAMEERGLDELR